jgi:plasmid stabilization system protein ParE
VAQVVWSSAALRDLVRLHDFLKSKNPDAAKRAVSAIRQSMSTLAAHPGIGRRAEDMPPEFREWRAPLRRQRLCRALSL